MGKGAHTTDNAFPSFLQRFLQHDGLLFLLLELTRSLPQATTSVTSIEYHNSLLVPVYIGRQHFESKAAVSYATVSLKHSLHIFMRSKALTFNYGPNKFKP